MVKATSTGDNPERPPRARLEDVARLAGVSTSIASRVLNNPALPVLPETRERVQSAVRRLNYRPHIGARALRGSGGGGAIGFTIPDLANPVYVRIIRAAWERAVERHYTVFVLEDKPERPMQVAFADLVDAGRIDGLIVASARPSHPLLASLRNSAVPHVFLNRSVHGSGRNVVMEDRRASEVAVDFLVELGHRRIGHVAGPSSLSTARHRAASFRKAAALHSLEDAPIEVGAFSEAGGADAAKRLLTLNPAVTGIYTSLLTQAIGALHTLWAMGIRVPEDVSLISYDDLELADYLRPSLTRIRMPLGDLGAAAVDALLDQIEGAPPKDLVIPTEPVIVLGASTMAPRGAPSA